MGDLIIENIILGSTSFLVIALLGWGIRVMKKLMAEHNSSHRLLQKANQKQIKATLLTMYRRAKREGQITTHELDVFEDLYETYQELGGNGFMTTIKLRIGKLKINTEDD